MKHRVRHRPGSGWRLLACLPVFCLLAAAARGEAAHGEAPHAEATTSRNGNLLDAISLIPGSAESWSVSKTDTGCFLMSASRKNSSRLAIGHSAKFGAGLFAVGLALALPEHGEEPVLIQVNGEGLPLMGRVVGSGLLFVPMNKADAEASLRELRSAGALWLMIRDTGITHGGRNLKETMQEYDRVCTDPESPHGG